MRPYLKAIICVVLATLVLVNAVAVAEETVDPEFQLLYATIENQEYKLVLTTKDFLTEANGIRTIRIYFDNGIYKNGGIRLHEVRAFTDEEGKGENVLLNTNVVGGPVQYQYLLEWIVNDVGFPADMQPNPSDKTGIGWGDKWYSGDLRGVVYITLNVPANIKRIELEMGYTNKGLESVTMSGIDIRVSQKAFTEDELNAKMNKILDDPNYVGALVLP